MSTEAVRGQVAGSHMGNISRPFGQYVSSSSLPVDIWPREGTFSGKDPVRDLPEGSGREDSRPRRDDGRRLAAERDATAVD